MRERVKIDFRNIPGYLIVGSVAIVATVAVIVRSLLPSHEAKPSAVTIKNIGHDRRPMAVDGQTPGNSAPIVSSRHFGQSGDGEVGGVSKRELENKILFLLSPFVGNDRRKYFTDSGWAEYLKYGQAIEEHQVHFITRARWLTTETMVEFEMKVLCSMQRMIPLFLAFFLITSGPAHGDQAAPARPPVCYQTSCPLDVPNMEGGALLLWASNAATDTLTFGFDDYHEALSKTQNNFTSDGWNAFQDMLAKSHALKNVIQYHQVLTTVAYPKSVVVRARIPMPPTIESEGVKDGVYQWMVTVPYDKAVRAGNVRSFTRGSVQLIIVRTPTSQNPAGVAIAQWAD